MNSPQLLISQILQLRANLPKKRKSQFWLILTLIIAAAFAEMMSIGAIFPFLGSITAPDLLYSNKLASKFIHWMNITDDAELIFCLTMVFCFAALLSGILRLMLLWAQTRYSHAVGADISEAIYRRALYQPYLVHTQTNTSEVIAGISLKSDLVVGRIVLPTMLIMSSTLLMISILIALIAIEPKVALSVFLGFGLVYTAIVMINKSRLRKAGKDISREQARVIKALQEGLGGIRDVLLDGLQQTYCTIFKNADAPLRRAQANILIIASSPRYIIESIGLVMIALLAFYLSDEKMGLTTMIPVLGALALGAQRMLPVLQQMYANTTSILGAQEILTDVLSLLSQSSVQISHEGPSYELKFNKEIKLRNISFSYSSSSPSVLQEINIAIPKGASVGIIGKTGSGKSTLLDILMGLLTPTGGIMEIDEYRLNNNNYREWQRLVAHVPQTIFLSDATIEENIAFGIPAPDINHALVRDAARQAQIHEDIEVLNEKYLTLVGERGVRLSGGQRQRIGIARALYKKASVIIFDEATSALDSITENKVINSVRALEENITIIMVAHRMETLRTCDFFLHVLDGKVQILKNFDIAVEASLAGNSDENISNRI